MKTWLYGSAVAVAFAGLGFYVTRKKKNDGLIEGWEAELDACFQKMTSENELLTVPGVVVKAYRHGKTYHKAFGWANKEEGRKMETDAQMRCFSMTKVMTTTVALMLVERGCLSLDDPVSEYLPSFKREKEGWDIVAVADATSYNLLKEGSIEYESFLTGQKVDIKYSLRRSKEVMRVKHLMSESSGIGYEQWSDYQLYDKSLKEPLGLHYGA